MMRPSYLSLILAVTVLNATVIVVDSEHQRQG